MDSRKGRAVDIGQFAPDFTLDDENDNKITLSVSVMKVVDAEGIARHVAHNDVGTARDQEKILEVVRQMAA